MKLYCDNNATINIAHNLVQYDRTKQVEVDHHFIKEKLEARLICMPYVPTEEQLADVLTKRLHKGMLNCLINKLEIINIFELAWGGVSKISEVYELVLFCFSTK